MFVNKLDSISLLLDLRLQIKYFRVIKNRKIFHYLVNVKTKRQSVQSIHLNIAKFRNRILSNYKNFNI